MVEMDKLIEYKNGNVKVTILKDGTKIREYEDIPIIEFPESIDVKITNYCDLNCAYCHENSTTKGNHANLDVLLSKLRELPAGVELAIGGGDPLSHPELYPFLLTLKELGLIANITVNQSHISRYKGILKTLIRKDLVKGIGISITSDKFDDIIELKKYSNNIVYHVIAGINDLNLLNTLNEIGNSKVLILGYKDFGRGIKYRSEEVDINLKSWYQHLPKYLNKGTISFDNLSIEQLNIKRLFTDKGWNKFYMGDDFTFTMYIDAVNEEYAPTSRSDNRISFKNLKLLDYFKQNKVNENKIEKEILLCNSCKYYESYRDAYEDELEPDDEGFCRGNDKKDYHTFGTDEACEYYTKMYP